MPEGSNADTLPIRCPSCGQRFKVGPDLTGRMVECGTCEHRFRVNDDVIVRSKRYYPGDRKDHTLERFSRVPMASSLPSGFQPAHYAQEPLPQRGSGPTSPLRLLCGALAALAILVVIYLLAFGGAPGGVLDGADVTKRVMLAVFGSVIISVLLLVANSNARGKATVFALLLSAGIISLPFVIKVDVHTTPATAKEDAKDELSALLNKREDGSPLESEDPLGDVKKEMGYSAYEKEVARGAPAPGKAILAVWLRDLKEYYKRQVGDYLIRVTGADLSSHMYVRQHGGQQDYLMILNGVDDDLDKLAKTCERFGEVKRVFHELNVIEISIRNDAFQEGQLDKLGNPKDPAFYELNLRELESIDLERARHSILRLTTAEPKGYRPDIVKRMQQLLKEGDREMQGQIAAALEVWSQDGDGSLEAVRAAAEKIQTQKAEMPESLISFLAKRKDLTALPMVDDLWGSDAQRWESPYSNLGSGAEDTLLKRYPTLTPTLRMSATRILARIGTAKSIPVLEASRPAATGEIKSMIDTAIVSIRGRIQR